jgi:hypothetical protein
MLLDALLNKHGRQDKAFPARTAFPVDYYELDMLFDPGRCDEVMARCADSWFMHLLNQFIRSSGVPRDAGPPEGSFLDRMFREYDVDVRFAYRVRYGDVKTWFDNFLAAQHHELCAQQLTLRVQELESRLHAPEQAV